MVGEETYQTNVIDISQQERRQIQLIQLEILLEIDRICRKNEIRYRITGGTLLGAVRHKGFIPWDPDADVSMNRDGYNVFYEACKQDLDTSRFFLQEWRTDPHYRWNYSRIIRKDTAYVRAGHEHMKQKTGIFVDIFYSDFVPDNKLLRPLHCFFCFATRKILWSEAGKKVHKNKFMRMWYMLLSMLPRDAVFMSIALVVKMNGNKPKFLCRNMAHSVSKHSKHKWGYPTKNLNQAEKIHNGELPWDYNLVDLEFEGYKLFATKNYEDALKGSFGDYMQLPPAEERVCHIPCSSLKLTKPVLNNYDELIKKGYENQL